MGTLARILLVLALAIASPIGGGRQPTPNGPGGVVREDGILGLTPVRLPRGGQVCLGSRVTLGFAVRNVSPGVEVPMPVVEAMVTVRDDQGITRALVTNGAGFAPFEWPAAKTGTLRFTVDATKQYYLPARTFSFSVEVIPCQWALKIDYHEEFAIISEVSLVVGAHVHWSGKIASGPANSDSGVSDLTVLGTGDYRFYASDQIQAPVHVSIDPPVSGTWELQGSGSTDGRTVRLDIGAVLPGSYPDMVTFKVTDYGPNNIQVHYKPPAPYLHGNGAFLEANKLNQLTFPAEGGIVTLASGMSTYLPAQPR